MGPVSGFGFLICGWVCPSSQGLGNGAGARVGWGTQGAVPGLGRWAGSQGSRAGKSKSKAQARAQGGAGAWKGEQGRSGSKGGRLADRGPMVAVGAVRRYARTRLPLLHTPGFARGPVPLPLGLGFHGAGLAVGGASGKE
jgi:hypothetical protein